MSSLVRALAWPMHKVARTAADMARRTIGRAHVIAGICVALPAPCVDALALPANVTRLCGQRELLSVQRLLFSLSPKGRGNSHAQDQMAACISIVERRSLSVELDHSFEVPLPPAEAWPVLMDIQK